MYVLVCRYNETNVMLFLFSLLRFKGLYTFRTLLAHPQEAFHKRHFVQCVRVVSAASGLEFHLNPDAAN
jgi:hypothetical protein